uniref:B-like cyclin n=1 Tax=Rhizophora mucronata TaxID=61149 RepID=A0A2P2JUJ9_RHIMU
MVAAKGKVTVCANQDWNPNRTVGEQSFRVYSDYDKDKLDTTRIKSSKESLVPPRSIPKPVNKGALLVTANNSKGILKIVEKTKGKLDSSDGRRKPLADVSNSQGNFSGNVVFDGSKKIGISVCSGSRTMNLPSRKSLVGLGKMRDNSSQKVPDSHIKRRGVKDLRAASNDQRFQIKNPSCKSTADNGRRAAKTSLPPIRKSLSISSGVNQADTNNTKESDQSLEKAKRISGFPVKAKVGNKAMRRVSIGRSHLWRNRVSDGFTIMAPRDEINVGACASSRKSIRPTVKTTIKASTTCRTSRSKCKSDTNKSTTSHPENIPIELSHHATSELPSKDRNELTKTKPCAVGRRKSDRRRSFTSLLMSGSESLEKPGEVSKKEKLPSIDDNCNQLEVAEYVDDIYQYYWVSEAQNLSLANYMSMQSDITPQMRGILINWLTEVYKDLSNSSLC